jgi:hypothetical protein
MDMMSRDLKWQSDWQKYKDNVNDDYRRRQGKGRTRWTTKGGRESKVPGSGSLSPT